MVDATYTSFAADDRSYFSIIKKTIHAQAENAGFETRKLGDLDLIVSEMTSNLYKYAKGGEILTGIFGTEENRYIEIISIDYGPGMSDPQRMMTDGYSSSNTLGMGMGSIKRLSDEFDLYSLRDWGTIVLSRLYRKPKGKPEINALSISICPMVINMPGQTTSGDGTYYKQTDNFFKLLVADGLGHGPEANFAVNEAVKAFRVCPYHSPAEILRFLHSSTLKTRGMVAAVVVFDFKKKVWQVAGVGNIAVRMSNFLEVKNLMSYNGIVGHNIPNTISDQEFSLSDFHQMTLCSDGIKSRWDIGKLTGIHRCDLSIQAAAIYKESARRNDDTSVVIVKINGR